MFGRSKKPTVPLPPKGELGKTKPLYQVVKETEAVPEGMEQRELIPRELKVLLDQKEAIVIDVREQWEWDLVHLEGSKLMPLGSLSMMANALDKGKFYVTICHTGNRSLTAQEILHAKGFKAKSLRGGILAWAADVDPTMKTY